MRDRIAEWSLLLAIFCGLIATLIGGIYQASMPYQMNSMYVLFHAPASFRWAFGLMLLFGVVHVVTASRIQINWRALYRRMTGK